VSKVRTINDLQILLDADLAWRIKEVSGLKRLVKSSKTIQKATATRAAIPLLYAHWEGFVKSAATHYLNYVLGQRLRYNQLRSCFIALGLKSNLDLFSSTMKADKYVYALDEIRSGLTSRANFTISSAIKTESNLNSRVFVSICACIGIDHSKYDAKANLIDVSLLQRRNKIAHGEFLDINADGFKDLAHEVVKLLRSFKTDIENCASLGTYKAVA